LSVAQSADLREIKTRLILLPFIFLILRLPDAIYRILQDFGHIVDKKWISSWMPLAVCIGVSSVGAANAVVFVLLTARVRQLYQRVFTDWCCWCFPAAEDRAGERNYTQLPFPDNQDDRGCAEDRSACG